MLYVSFINVPSIDLTTLQISTASSAVSSTIASTTEPIRNTEAYKAFAETVVDALDDSYSAKHAGYEDKEARRKRRAARLAKAGKKNIAARSRVVADPESVNEAHFSQSFKLIRFPELVLQWSCTKTLLGKSDGTS